MQIAAPPPVRIELPDADLRYWAAVDWGATPDEIMERLLADTPWRQDHVRVFGKVHAQPRLHAWIGDAGCRYRYSGLMLEPEPWSALLSDLRTRIEALTGAQFNSVLVNLYRDGNDCMGYHSDDERELGPEPVIASLSLGHPRDMLFRRKAKGGATARVPLESGSLLIMAGATQQNWKHGIARTKRPVRERINLTFRFIHQA